MRRCRWRARRAASSITSPHWRRSAPPTRSRALLSPACSWPLSSRSAPIICVARWRTRSAPRNSGRLPFAPPKRRSANFFSPRAAVRSMSPAISGAMIIAAAMRCSSSSTTPPPPKSHSALQKLADALRDRRDAVALARLRFPIEEQPVAAAPRHDVQMKMADRLSGALAIRLHQVEAVAWNRGLDRLRDLCCCAHRRREILRLDPEHGCRMCLRDHEAMSVMYRVDVHKRERRGILVELKARD